MRVRRERITQQIYIGSLLYQELHLVSRNHWVFLQAINKFDYKPHTKEVILNPSRTHTSFGKHYTTNHITPFGSTQNKFTEL